MFINDHQFLYYYIVKFDKFDNRIYYRVNYNFDFPRFLTKLFNQRN